MFGGELRNLIIASGNVKGTNFVGAFASYIDCNGIYNCTNYANVTGNSDVGGIAGGECVNGVQIHNCTNYGTITGRTYVDEIWGANGISSNNYENCTKSGKVVIL